HLRHVLEHRLRTLTSVLGIASGVALVVATAALLTSATATATATIALLGGATSEITIPAERLDETLAVVADVDGVDAVARFVEVPIMVDDVQAWLVALDASADEVRTSEARALSATTGVRTGTALPETGSPLFTGPSGVPTSFGIGGRADAELADRYGGRIVAADLDTALRLRGHAGTETLLVYGRPDPDELASAVGQGDIRSTEARVAQARNTVGVMFTSLSVLGAMGLVVGAFLLFNTMNMSVLERRHEIASLRALGATRRSILTGVLAEAALLGAAGSALGIGLGTLLARSVIAAVPDAFTRTIGTPLRASVPPWLLATAWLLGIVAAAISAIAPARRALAVEPLEALRPDTPDPTEHRVRRRLWLTGVGLALTVIPRGELGIGAAMLGLLCLTAGTAPFINATTVGIARRLGPSGELAATALRRSPRRAWGTTTVVIIAVTTAVATTGQVVNLSDTTNRNLATVLQSDFWIGTSTGDTIAVTGLPSEWTSQLEAVPGVEAVAASTWIAAESGDHIVGIQGIYGNSAYPFSKLADDDALAEMAAGRGVIVIKQTALTFHLEVGDTIDIPGAIPALQLPVVAITNAVSPSSGGMMNISHDLLTRHYGTDSFARYEIQLTPGADPAEVRHDIEQITRSAGPQIQIYTGQQFLDQLSRSTDQVLALVALSLLVIVGCAAIALLNTLLASTLERTSEIATLRAIGATRRRIVTSIAAEALAIGVTGSLIGAAAGSIYHAKFVQTLQTLTAFDVDYAFSPITLVAAIAIGIVIATVGAITPCRRANHLDILDAPAR
ncbi:MAG: ABC transporter permease, partial [Acidimicrobiales bacterium]|nr:ABC transporter permease [Acidimicrobiales bacterium]